jgi:hypothetical protein
MAQGSCDCFSNHVHVFYIFASPYLSQVCAYTIVLLDIIYHNDQRHTGNEWGCYKVATYNIMASRYYVFSPTSGASDDYWHVLWQLNIQKIGRSCMLYARVAFGTTWVKYTYAEHDRLGWSSEPWDPLCKKRTIINFNL